MKLLLVGTDRTLFDPQSPLAARFVRFARDGIESLDSIVFGTRAHGISNPTELAAHVHAHPTNSSSRLLYGWDALRLARTLPRPDIVSAQDPFETGLAALFIARYFRVPLAVEVHTDFISPEFAHHSFLNRIRVLIAGFVLPRAAGGYAVSQRVRDAMVKKYSLAKPFEVFPIYVYLEKFRALPRVPKKGNLLWIGRFAREKNSALAVEAFAAARAASDGKHADNDLHLTMLGSGPLDTELRRLAEELGVDAYVSFPGWRDPADYLPETELVLATSRYEGYGMSIVEALAAGVPVLSTDVGVAREAGAITTQTGNGKNAKDAYKAALLAWLSGPRPHKATLVLPTYQNELDYFSRIKNFYRSLLETYR